MDLDRRSILLGIGAAATGNWEPIRRIAGRVVSVTDYGAIAGGNADATGAIQAAIDSVERSDGGTVVIPGQFRCGNIVISRGNVCLQGQRGILINGRLTINRTASNIEVSDLTILDTTKNPGTYLADISGSDCRFSNFHLEKNPVAAGVQMYLRQTSARCHFNYLRLRGSNGIILAGSDHLFEKFDLQSGATTHDDAFAIDAVNAATERITIRDGIVQGFSALVSFGSAIGSRGGTGEPGVVRDVIVENVTGTRCSRVAFIKPGALTADYRDGVVEGVRLQNLTLNDPSGDRFRSGIQILAGRGASVRQIEARGVQIIARAKDRGVAPTSAIHIALINKGDPASIKDVNVQLKFIDPFSGAPNGRDAPGEPIDYIVRIEKRGKAVGSMLNIVLDVEGRGASRGGVFVGPSLDGAVRLERAILTRVATDPPNRSGGGGIWSQSRVSLGDIEIDAVKLPSYGGRAFRKRD